MIEATATQGVLITLIVVVGCIVIAWFVARKTNEPAVMKAQAEIAEEKGNHRALRNHRERMAQVEYDRAVQNLERDRALNELEMRRLARELEAGPKPTDDKKWSDG